MPTSESATMQWHGSSSAFRATRRTISRSPSMLHSHACDTSRVSAPCCPRPVCHQVDERQNPATGYVLRSFVEYTFVRWTLSWDRPGSLQSRGSDVHTHQCSPFNSRRTT